MLSLSATIKSMLTVVMGLGWLFTYILIIHRSVKDRTYGMPLIALSLNISWEFLYGFVFIPDAPGLQTQINRLWCVLDLLIVVSYIRFGRSTWPPVFQRWFYPAVAGVFGCAFLLLYGFEQDFPGQAITYSAFLMNVLISAGFVHMLMSRQSIAGQSTGIAFCKLIGSAAATVILLDGYTWFLRLLGLLSLLLDLLYFMLLIRQYKLERRSVWTRQRIA